MAQFQVSSLFLFCYFSAPCPPPGGRGEVVGVEGVAMRLHSPGFAMLVLIQMGTNIAAL